MIIKPRWRRLALCRTSKAIALFLALWTIVEVVRIRHNLIIEAAQEIPPFNTTQKIYIASIHWTDERLLREHWIPSMLALATALGPANVFVSVHESGSFDDTKGALLELDSALEAANIPRKIVLDETTHLDEVSKAPEASGWVQMPMDRSYRQNWTEWFTLPQGMWVPRRIPYLARLRNLVMRPLVEMRENGQVFDRVLWLNDVVFDPDDARRLLGTRDGEYAAACALDFKTPPAFYDTFALRDADGYEPLMETWPYFRSRSSRQAILHGRPAPVASCWNGMVAFDAAPFYDILNPLTFRGVDDSLATSHLEGSECCLIHADNPLSASKGIWINPDVRVAYNGTEYETVHPSGSGLWIDSLSIVRGLWENRLLRWFNPAFSRSRRAVASKVATWSQQSEAHQEPGTYCLIDEMQIMLWNGWGHA